MLPTLKLLVLLQVALQVPVLLVRSSLVVKKVGFASVTDDLTAPEY